MSHPEAAAADTVARLARVPDLRALPIAALHAVCSARLFAAAERANLDPLPDLARRLHSLEAALACEDMVRSVARCWPEPFMVNRPCCLALSPDEVTLAAMTRAAMAADDAGFRAVLAGFVAERHHPLLQRVTRHAVALIVAAGTPPARSSVAQ